MQWCRQDLLRGEDETRRRLARGTETETTGGFVGGTHPAVTPKLFS